MIAAVAHETALAQRVGEKGTVRDSYEVKVSRARRMYGEGSSEYRAAVEALEGPQSSDALAYLSDWSDELFGRSGVDANGLTPMTWGTIDAWARRTGRDPQPHEVDALFALDHARRVVPTDDEVTDG